MKTVLIAYASRYGGSEHLAERIADMVKARDVMPQLLDLKSHPPKLWLDFGKYGGVVIGTGIKIGKWSPEAEDALTEVQQARTIPYGVFVSCFDAYKLGAGEAVEKYIAPKLSESDAQPAAVAAFGPVFDLSGAHKVGFIDRKIIGSILKGIRKDGIDVPDGELTALVGDDDLEAFVTGIIQAL